MRHAILTTTAAATLTACLTACALPATTTTQPPATTDQVQPAAAYTPTAADVVAYFEGAGLPARDPRENECRIPGCMEMITTDDVTVLRFDSPVRAEQIVARWGDDAVQVPGTGLVVGFAAARTPQGARARYAVAAVAAAAPPAS